MRISRKRLMMIIALVFTLCAVTEVYGRGGGGGGRNGMGSGGGYGSPTASINARLHMDENPADEAAGLIEAFLASPDQESANRN